MFQRVVLCSLNSLELRTRGQKTKLPYVIRLFSLLHRIFTVRRGRAPDITRDQNKENYDTPEKAVSTCKPATTGKERPSRRSGKPKLARRAAVNEGEPSRPFYHLSRAPTLLLSLPF